MAINSKKALPEVGLEGNRIIRDSLYPTTGTVAQKQQARVQAANGAGGSALGVRSMVTPVTTVQAGTAGALAGALGGVGTTGQKKSGRGGSGTKVPPTNPYADQMAAAQATMGKARPTYTDSYGGRIADMEAAGPGTYTSRYQPNIDGLLDKLQNREAFQYNMSEDPLYRQLAAQYMATGKQAMQDTMGKAAALTGGYGSSYASTAGNQVYQQQLNQLNDKAIDLYTLARQNYDAKGDEMRSNLSALQTAESMDRSNYESDRADYYNRLNALRDGQATEYQRYIDEQSLLDAEQQRAWEQYKYWNDLWESKQ